MWENMYNVVLSKEAIKYYKKCDKKKKQMINIAVNNIKEDPYTNTNIKKLHGALKGYYRYRVGTIRIVYKIEEQKITVYITTIGNRGDVYK